MALCASFLVKILYYYYKDLFTHKDINTYINGVVQICLNKFFENIGFQKKWEKYAKLCTNRKQWFLLTT